MFNVAAWVIYGIPVHANKTNIPVVAMNIIKVGFKLLYVVLFIIDATSRRLSYWCCSDCYLVWLLGTHIVTHIHGIGHVDFWCCHVSDVDLQDDNAIIPRKVLLIDSICS
jgi:hypothetical protein